MFQNFWRRIRSYIFYGLIILALAIFISQFDLLKISACSLCLLIASFFQKSKGQEWLDLRLELSRDRDDFVLRINRQYHPVPASVAHANNQEEAEELLNKGTIDVVIVAKGEEESGCDIYCRNKLIAKTVLRVLPVLGREYMADSASNHPIIYETHSADKVLLWLHKVFEISSGDSDKSDK